jgi:trans-aconitate methyltransferase
MKINSKEYWDYRFDNNWINRNGINQTEAFMNLLVNHLPIAIKNYLSTKCTVLDWGCGIGVGVKVLANTFTEATVSGMDLSESAIIQSSALYPNYDFIASDISKAKKKYDVIVSSNVLEHFNDPHLMIAELMKKSKKYVVILVPYKETHVGGDNAEHQYSFNDDSFPKELNGFKLTDKIVIKECPNCWMWEQVLVVYEKKE